MTLEVQRKYSDHFTDLLLAAGYSHCFFVPGGNVMHLLDSARTRMTCIPFVHEASAVIAAEYFNAMCSTSRAYALVTAGPGLTNAVTGMAGAYLESRDVLVVGGQVKSSDLARGAVRQRGIQEIDGVAIAAPISKTAVRIERPWPDDDVVSVLSDGLTDRRGPVFIEFCLDAQGAAVSNRMPVVAGLLSGPSRSMREAADEALPVVVAELQAARRPVLLIGGGVQHSTAALLRPELEALGIPLMTTWNGFDRVPDTSRVFSGRPNTWGQRSANVLMAQSDLVVALGTRLGIQQTGFNWQEWGPTRVVQVDVDAAELTKGHPRVDVPIQADANRLLELLCSVRVPVDEAWVSHCRLVREAVPLLDPANRTGPGFLSPFDLVEELSSVMGDADVLVPASSGSGQFVPMEVFRSLPGQRVLTNKGLASMGYGLAGAIGAALAAPESRTVLVEGDGSFSQNSQELGTLVQQELNVKVFLLDNDGYASIRSTQRNYFGGEYLGCDSATGLGFPDWSVLAEAFGVPCVDVGPRGLAEPQAARLMAAPGPAMFIVRVDPEQTYFPKVTSSVSPTGSMVSNPIHKMTPELPEATIERIYRFRKGEGE